MVIKRAERDAKKKVKGNRANRTRETRNVRGKDRPREGHKGEKIERYTKDEPRRARCSGGKDEKDKHENVRR